MATRTNREIYMSQLDSLRALFIERLDGWCDDQRGTLDDDLLDMLDTAAKKVFEKLPELESFTDESLAGAVDDLDEDAIRETFEAFAELWDEVEWRYQTKAPDPKLLEEQLVNLERFFREDVPDEEDIEDYVHALERYLQQCGYQYVI